jgi:hypothetical protein
MLNKINRVKVIGSTYNDREEPLKMIGGEFDVDAIHVEEKLVSVFENKDESWDFNLSDIQFVTPVKYNGQSICIGDTVNGIEVEDWMQDAMTNYVLIRGGSYWTSIDEDDITSHTPKYPRKDVIEINGKKYDAKEVEERLKELKEIK